MIRWALAARVFPVAFWVALFWVALLLPGTSSATKKEDEPGDTEETTGKDTSTGEGLLFEIEEPPLPGWTDEDDMLLQAKLPWLAREILPLESGSGIPPVNLVAPKGIAKILADEERALESLVLEDVPHAEVSDFLPGKEQPLIDPQNLLTTGQQETVRRLLHKHAATGTFAISIMILKKNQRLPETLDVRARMNRWYAERPAVLLIYPLGLPVRSKLVLSPGGSELISLVESIDLRDACLDVARPVRDPAAQLGQFLVALTGDVERRAADARARAAVRPHPRSQPDAESHFLEWFILFLAVGAAALVLGATLRYSMRQLSWTGKMIFPQRKIFPRLGGVCSGGGHAEISFDKRSLDEHE